MIKNKPNLIFIEEKFKSKHNSYHDENRILNF